MSGGSQLREETRLDRYDYHILSLLAAFVLVALTLTGAAVYVGSARLDDLRTQHEEQSVAQWIDTLQEGMKTSVVDYTWWDEAIENLLVKPDPAWATANIGPYALKTLKYDVILVLGNDGRPFAGWSNGTDHVVETERKLQPTLGQLLAELRHSGTTAPTPVSGIVMTSDGPAVVAASYFTPQPNGKTRLPANSRGALVFAKRLNQTFFSEVQNVFGLSKVHILAPGEAPASLATTPLIGMNGQTVALIGWEPWHPGRSQLLWLIPALLGSIAVFLLFVLLVMRSIHKTTNRIRFSETRFRDIASASSDWIWEVDAALRFTYVSEQFATSARMTPDLVVGQPLIGVLMPAPEDRQRLADCLSRGEPFRDALFHLQSSDGGLRRFRLAGKVVHDGQGRFAGYRGTARDVTAEMAALEQVTHLAKHDALTDLPNRLLLSEALQQAIQKAAEGGLPIAILLIDLDRFKEVNDSLGHGVGDMLLKACAERLRRCVRKQDLIARLGGDEFAILQSGVSGSKDVEELARRITETLGMPCRLQEHDILIEASIGGAILPASPTTAERLMQNADIALYRAKVLHAFCLYEPGMEEELHVRKALEAGLRRALLLNELEVHYQPLVAAATGNVVGVEALLRWRQPNGGAVPTDQLISIAEESCLIDAIGQWVISRACRDGLAWPGLNISINVSPVQFRRGNLVAVIRRALAETGIDPRRLEIEVTENVLLSHTSRALAIMHELKQLGISIALDDFGKGYSNLSYIKDFPFDKLKIDRTFVAGLEHDKGSVAIVRAAIGLGKSFNVRTCAEGVETRLQMEILRAEACDELQGFLFGKPMAPNEIDLLLQRQELACA